MILPMMPTPASYRRLARIAAGCLAAVAVASGCAGAETSTQAETGAPSATAAPAESAVSATPTATTSSAADGASISETRIDLPFDVVAVEGIAVDPATARLFVGDLGNGQIWAGQIGAWDFELFATAESRQQAIGLAVDTANRRLLVVTGEAVDAHSLDDGTFLGTIEFPTGADSFINDVVVAADGTAFVTDTGLPRIYSVAPDSFDGELWVDYTDSGVEGTSVTGLQGNGVEVDTDWVLVAHMVTGTLLRVDRTTQEITVLNVDDPAGTGRDGLARCGDLVFGAEITAFSDGPEKIWVSRLGDDARSITPVAELLDPSFSSPATMALFEDKIIAVNAQFERSDLEAERPFWLTVLDSGC